MPSNTNSSPRGERFHDPFASQADRPAVSESNLNSLYPSSQDPPASLHRSYSLTTSTSSHPSSVFSSGPSPTPSGLSELTVGAASKERGKALSIEPTILEAAQFAADVLIEFTGHEIRVNSFELRSTWKGLTISWNRRDAGAEPIEQRLPPGRAPIPFSVPSSQPQWAEVVSFHREQEIKYGGQKYYGSPRFCFAEQMDSLVFQSAVRRAHHIATYKTESVATSMSLRPGESTKQHLKLWKSRTSSRHYITYFANNADQPTHREFPIRWFDRPGTYSKSRKPPSLRLNFTNPKRSNDGRSRRPSDNFGSHGSEAVSTESSPDWSSRSSSAVSFENDADYGMSPSEEAYKLKYIDVAFNDDTGCEQFLKEFTAAYDEALSSEYTGPTSSPRTSSAPRSAPPREKADKAVVQSQAPPLQRATPAGILGLNLSLSALGLD